ncbi:MAG: hypothetical protein PHG84_05700 [Endomicrobiaceae bacterium]|nr:hypothetical protein [Endomicrobiaceae bacterium]MDD3922998.1 hypothetical protein [Endomicrobiaceae bacterium]
MWKKIRYVLYFLVLIVIFSITVSDREYYYVPIIQNHINKITNSKIKFRNFSISLPFEISIYDIEYDNEFLIDKATLKFDPLIFFQNLKKPLKSLVAVNINKLIYIDQNNKPINKDNPVTLSSFKIQILKNILKLFNLNILIKNTNILYQDYLLKATDTEVHINENIKLTTFVNYNNHNLNLTGTIDLTNTSLVSNFDIDLYGNVKLISALSGQYNLTDNSFDYKLQTKQFTFDKLLFGKSNTYIKKDNTGLLINSQGDFGTLFYKAEPTSFDIWNSSGSIIIRDSNDILHTDVDYSATMQNKLLNISIQTKNTKILNNNFGTLDIKVNNNNDQINLSCYHNTNNTFNAVIQKNGNYTIDIYTKKIRNGQLIGNYKTGEVSVDIKNIPIRKLPFLSSFKKIKGQVSLYGNIGKTSGNIFLQAKNISSKKLKQFDTFGKISKEYSKWIFDIATKDKKLVMKGFYETKKHHNIEFYYSGVDSNNLLKMLGFNPQLSGLATGYIKYDSNELTQIDINLKNGYLFENKFSDWTILGTISPTTINISTFIFKGKKSYINLKTLFDFTKNNQDSYLNCDVRNFKFKNININSHILFNGKISNNEDEIIGKLYIPNLQLNNFHFDNLSSDINLSTKQLHIKNIENKNGLLGKLIYNFKTNDISSNIKTIKTQISKHYKDMDGLLNSTTTINGTLTNPKIEISANIKKGFLSSLNFTLDTKIVYKDKKTYLKKLKILVDKAVINASGIIDTNKTKIKIDFKDINEKAINKYINYTAPLEGIFYGDGTISGKLSNLKCLINLSSDIVYIKSVKFHSLNSKIEINKNIVSINQANIKISDSEITILSGEFNTKTGYYSSILNIVNAHLGPFDIFGNINLNGFLIKNKNAHTYKGNIEFDNIWLNRAKIKLLNLNYTIANKKIIFKTPSQQNLKISGIINFINYPRLQFDKIAICNDNQICNFTGSSTSNKLNINLEGKFLDSSSLTDIFDLPFDMDGNIDIKLKATGDISKPNISCTLNSKKGNIQNIPYDTCNINLNIKNNILNINEFKIQKTDEYTANVKGTYPFWIDSSLDNQMMNKKINIHYELIDNKLTILRSITQDSISTKKGNLKIEGSLSGTRKNISNTGKLTIAATDITTNSYVHKFKNLDIDIVWKDGLLEIKEFSAKAGSGLLDITGKIKFNGFTPSFYDLSIFTSKKGIPIVIHELPIPTSGLFKIEKTQTLTNFSKGNPRFNFKLYGNTDDLKLTGWAELKNTRFCYPSPIKNKKNNDFDIEDLFKNLKIDIDLKAASDTRYENTFANVFLRGGINLKGKIDEIITNGIIESNNGRLSYMGNDFDIINTKIEIINNELFISGEADTEVFSTGESEAEVIKVLVDRSRMSDIKTRFISKDNPTLESNKVLARLTKTDPTQNTMLDTSTDFLVKQQLIRLFGSNIATPLANTVLKRTGIVDNVRLGYINQDNLQVDSKDEPTMAELLYGMKYSVEKNINRLLLVGYSVTFDQIEREIDLKHALEMSFRINKDLFLKGSYGLQSNDPLYEPEKKLMIEQRIKFGGPSKK